MLDAVHLTISHLSLRGDQTQAQAQTSFLARYVESSVKETTITRLRS